MTAGLTLLALAALLVAALVAERGRRQLRRALEDTRRALAAGEAAHAESAREREAEAVRRGAEAARHAEDTAQRETEAARQAQHMAQRDAEAAQHEAEAARQAQRAALRDAEAALRDAEAARQAQSAALRDAEAARQAQHAALRDAEAAQREAEATLQAQHAAHAALECAKAIAETERQAALEEARQARAERDSFALEVRVLRAELSTARKPAEKAAEKLAGTSVKPRTPKTSEQPGKTSWWCQQCGRGGTRPERCCR
ncbi:hypothetical protein WMF27_46690 [Sorangium sp. So ce281]|uniref:hypothetical protein n=1 Tax=unclassified Sorangium TaxID=2621164 RepID=UPI003F625CBB